MIGKTLNAVCIEKRTRRGRTSDIAQDWKDAFHPSSCIILVSHRESTSKATSHRTLFAFIWQTARVRASRASEKRKDVSKVSRLGGLLGRKLATLRVPQELLVTPRFVEGAHDVL